MLIPGRGYGTYPREQLLRCFRSARAAISTEIVQPLRGGYVLRPARNLLCLGLYLLGLPLPWIERLCR